MELSYDLLGLTLSEILEVQNAESVSLQSLQAIAKDGLLQKARYSVFHSAEVQKLWVLGKRQQAKGKREEK